MKLICFRSFPVKCHCPCTCHSYSKHFFEWLLIGISYLTRIIQLINFFPPTNHRFLCRQTCINKCTTRLKLLSSTPLFSLRCILYIDMIYIKGKHFIYILKQSHVNDIRSCTFFFVIIFHVSSNLAINHNYWFLYLMLRLRVVLAFVCIW